MKKAASSALICHKKSLFFFLNSWHFITLKLCLSGSNNQMWVQAVRYWACPKHNAHYQHWSHLFKTVTHQNWLTAVKMLLHVPKAKKYMQLSVKKFFFYINIFNTTGLLACRRNAGSKNAILLEARFLRSLVLSRIYFTVKKQLLKLWPLYVLSILWKISGHHVPSCSLQSLFRIYIWNFK